jgi:hypothetical protein
VESNSGKPIQRLKNSLKMLSSIILRKPMRDIPNSWGQNVYYVGARMGGGENSRLFSVRVKVDIQKNKEALPSYKAHKVNEIEPDPFRAQSANAKATRSAWGSTEIEPDPFRKPSADADTARLAWGSTEIESDPFRTQSANAEAIRSAWGSISKITLEVLSGKVNPSVTTVLLTLLIIVYNLKMSCRVSTIRRQIKDEKAGVQHCQSGCPSHRFFLQFC